MKYGGIGLNVTQTAMYDTNSNPVDEGLFDVGVIDRGKIAQQMV